jgi:hypothetical protein
MKENFLKVKNFILDMGYEISREDENDGMLIINNSEEGISNLIIGCAPPLLIIEQFIVDIPKDSNEIYKNLLIKNRDIVHGAFAIDETGTRVIFRDTLQIENLDYNEIESSINSLSLLLSEYSASLIEYSKN